MRAGYMNRVYGGAEGEMITYKFRLYLTEEQEENLMFILEQCRWLYNKLLSIWSG